MFKDTTVNDTVVFSKTVDAYKTLLQAKDKTLENQVDRIWTQLTTRRYRFNFTTELMKVADRVTHEGFKSFYNTYVASHSVPTGSDVDSVRELVVGAFQNVTSLQFDDINSDRQYRLKDLRAFKKNTTSSWQV